MLGTEEIFRLFSAARDERFLDYFGRGDVPQEQVDAFEEFVFGLSYEEIQKLRRRTRFGDTGLVSREQARNLVSSASGEWVFEATLQEILKLRRPHRDVVEHEVELQLKPEVTQVPQVLFCGDDTVDRRPGKSSELVRSRAEFARLRPGGDGMVAAAGRGHVPQQWRSGLGGRAPATQVRILRAPWIAPV